MRRQSSLTQARRHRHEVGKSSSVVQATRTTRTSATRGAEMIQRMRTVAHWTWTSKTSMMQSQSRVSQTVGRKIHRSTGITGISGWRGRMRGRGHHLGNILQGCRFYRRWELEYVGKNDLKNSLLRWDLRGDPEYPPVRISFSGAILYCEATNLWTAFSSSKKIFIRMNGSRPFCVSMCQGLGRASKSETDPCESPRTDSPNRRWLIEYWLSCSFTYWTIIDKLIQGSEGMVRKFELERTTISILICHRFEGNLLCYVLYR